MSNRFWKNCVITVEFRYHHITYHYQWLQETIVTVTKEEICFRKMTCVIFNFLTCEIITKNSWITSVNDEISFFKMVMHMRSIVPSAKKWNLDFLSHKLSIMSANHHQKNFIKCSDGNKKMVLSQICRTGLSRLVTKSLSARSCFVYWSVFI